MKRKLTSCLLVAGFMLATAPSVLAETYFIKLMVPMEQTVLLGNKPLVMTILPRIWNKEILPMAMSFVLPVECINCPLPISTNI